MAWKDARIVSASEEVRARRSMESCTIQMNGDIIMNMMVVSGERKAVLSRLVSWAHGEALSGAASTRDLLIAKGAIVKSDVTRNCDYLVVGLEAAVDSPKVEKVIKQRDSGKSSIKIIPEDELLRILSQDKGAEPEKTCRFDQDAHIAFQNKHFVLTCFELEESRVIAEIEKRGGIFHDSMVKQADYPRQHIMRGKPR